MYVFKTLLLGAAASLVSVCAAAQETAPPAKPDAGASAWTVDARLTAAGIYTDNLFATQNRKQSDTIVSLQPFASVSLGNNARRLTLQAQGDLARHDRNASEDYDDWKLGLDGRARLAAPLSLVGGAEYAWQHEARTSPDAEAGLTPTEFRRGYGSAGLLFDGDAFRARLAATVKRLDFSDVTGAAGTINGDDRDRTEREVGLRLGRPLGAGLEVFVQGAYDRRTYDDAIDDAGYRRGSDGYSAAVGIRRAAGAGVTGELFAGVMRQDYADPRLKDVATFDLGAVVDWTVASDVTGSLRLDRSIEETTLPGASAYVVTSGSLGLRAAVHPRVAVGAGLSGSRYDYIGSSRTEFVSGADVWGRYWVNPRGFVGLDYSFSQRTSNAAGYDYDENRFVVTLGAQLQPAYGDAAAPLSGLFARQAPAGFYAAALAGHGALTTGLDGPRGSGSNTADFGALGTGYAGVVGYGILAGRAYAGLELDGEGAGPKWVHVADRSFSVDRRDSYGLSGRLGFVTAPGAMVFARAGVADTRFRTAYVHAGDATFDTTRRRGAVVGLGVEGGDERVFLRADYSIATYPDYDIATGAGAVDNFSNAETEFRIGAGVRLGARAPEAGEATRFGGAYGGLTLGHGALESLNTGPRTGGSTVAVDRSTDGPLIGGVLGAGVSFLGFYLGGELDADWSNIEWNIDRDPTGRTFSALRGRSTGLALRLGRQVGPATLAYVLAGPVRTQFAIDYATSNASVAEKTTRKGTRIGAGLETGLSRRLRMRFEYDVTTYDAFQVPYGNLVDEFDNKEGILRVSIIRKFS